MFEELNGQRNTYGGFGREGGTRKIAELPDSEICNCPEHNPPLMMVFPDGVYEHVCPRCKHKSHFTIRNPRLN